MITSDIKLVNGLLGGIEFVLDDLAVMYPYDPVRHSRDPLVMSDYEDRCAVIRIDLGEHPNDIP